MKKRFLTLLICMAFFITSLPVITAEDSEGQLRHVMLRVPYEADLTTYKVIKARYSDTTEPIPLSTYYDGMLYALVPYNKSTKAIEGFEPEALEFTDYSSSDYRFHTFKELSRTGIIKGNEKGEALPDSSVTRAEAVAMVIRMLGIDPVPDVTGEVNLPFYDVKKTDWFYDVVATAYQQGIVKGDSDTYFSPLRSVSREETAVMLSRATDTDYFGYPGDDGSNATDSDRISDWAKEAYEKYGTFLAFDIDNTDAENPKRLYTPGKAASRYEIANMIYRVCEDCVVFPSDAAIKFGFDSKMPKVDGSTSTYPFTEAVYRNLFSNGLYHTGMPEKHSKSHQSYTNLIDGKIDMMFASVYPASDILEYAKGKNVELELIPIAYDAMIFFTNIENPATNLTKQQISDIYVNNAYGNWNQLGGPDALLYPYCRNNDSGSHAQMEKHFLNGNEIHKTIREETTSMTMSNVLTDVQNSKTDNPMGYGLGYSIYYYYNNMDMFYNTKSTLKLLAIDGILPTDDTIADGTYPLSNNTYVVLKKDTPVDHPARRMAEFMLTKKGQDCVEEAGFGRLKTTESKSFNDKLNAYIKEDKNYVYSPLSIKLALALAANGADGETKEEILSALNYTDIEEINALAKELNKKYSQTEHLALKLANSVWINKDNTSQRFSYDYKSGIKNIFDGEALVTDNKNAIKDVNNWVSDKTKGKISSVINNPDFWAMLVNTVYFKGLWEDDFSEQLTKPDVFYNLDGTEAQVDFMHKRGWIPYTKDNDTEAIRLDFKNRFDKFDISGSYKGSESFNDLDINMYFMLSDKVDIEAELLRLIKDNAFSSRYIDLSLPKFKVEYETSLNEILTKLGIKRAFTMDAEFEKMFDKGSMNITDTIHKTYLSVDELGCEAAAVTAMAMAGSALPPEPIKVDINRPFYFILRDDSNGEILFTGRFITGK